MKLSNYLSTREGALKENRVSRIIIATLAGVVLLLSFALVNRTTTVVMVPPTLEAASAVGAGEASKETKIAWGLYLVGVLGNVTPRTAPFVKENVSRHLTPAMYNTLVEAIDAQVKEITQDQLTLSFAPTTARFDDPTGAVVVSGELVVRGLRGQERREMRSYEMKFVTRNYNVMLDSLRIMEGKYEAEKADDAQGAAP